MKGRGWDGFDDLIRFDDDLLTIFAGNMAEDRYKDAEIIGGGGIQTLNDIRDYKKAGANHFSISTLCFNPIRFLSFYYDFVSLKN